MMPFWVLVPVLLVLLVTAQNTVDVDDCDVLDKDVRKTLDTLFSRLPAAYPVTITDGVEVLVPKLVQGNSTIFGLNHLQPDRPYQAFCKGDEAFVYFSLLSAVPLKMTIPWNFCSEHNGTFSMSVGLARYEGHFVVTRSPEGRPLLRLERFIPTLLEGISLKLGGVPSGFGKAVEILGLVLAEPVRLVWLEWVSLHIRIALTEAMFTLQSSLSSSTYTG